MKNMPKSYARTPADWKKIIEAVNTPIALYVFIFLIAESFLIGVSVVCGFHREDGIFVIKIGAGLFAYELALVTILVWFRHDHLVFDKESILTAQNRMPSQEELKSSTTAKAEATSKILWKFWRPDGKTANKRNEARLEKWMKANRISDAPITTFIMIEYFARLRAKAIRDLGIGPGEES
jgi:hypothetical protein